MRARSGSLEPLVPNSTTPSSTNFRQVPPYFEYRLRIFDVAPENREEPALWFAFRKAELLCVDRANSTRCHTA